MTTIFFSWQMDTEGRCGRNLIRKALEDAINAIAAEAQIEDAPRDELLLDSDTANVPGSPPIVDTILEKIQAADVFVADLTFVGSRRDGRPTPNPNVLIEYGYALHALSHRRVIGVMNAASSWASTTRAQPLAMPTR